MTSADQALARFSEPTRAWFASSFAAPTPAQAQAWDAISAGKHALVVAPTGSGKTLAAFLWALDRLAASPPADDPKLRCRVLYVSPLKALAVDVERNLRAPLSGIRRAAERLGQTPPDIGVDVRSGDTPADERRRFAKTPSDILITTPESLFLILTSQAREALAGVEYVIVDEVHAMAGTKRGAHLAVALERLDALTGRTAQRIGLSATVRPVDEVATYLGGGADVAVVQPPSNKVLDIQVVVPVEDMQAPSDHLEADQFDGGELSPQERASIWPAVEDRIVDLVEAHRSTIIFTNSRRLAERLTTRINEIAHDRAVERGEQPHELARAHHGSVSRERRREIEEELKAGRLPAVVATSSLELGIDMGAVDLVVQIESPPSVASGLQRIGRAGHNVGDVSRGIVLPKHRGDLLAASIVVQRMHSGAIESIHMPRNPLDVLAQHIVSMLAMDSWTVDELFAVVRRAAPYHSLSERVFEGVLDMLAGRYPSDAFAELRPRIVWDRVTGALTARPGAQRLAVTNGGTIPDRGLFGVHIAGARGARIGELDEEMVYESRVGDVFTLGSSSWRIEEINADRVIVTPAPGEIGKVPFWHGDNLGRPVELGKALGAFVRELSGSSDDKARTRLSEAGLDDWAAGNLLQYLAEQKVATRHVPDDRTLVVERFRDEIGDWRIAVHSPYGAPVHAAWALAMRARLRERYGFDAQVIHTDDGVLLRLPDIEDTPPTDIPVFDPDEIADIVQAELGGSALFAGRFREAAGRALLLPRRMPGRRTPLWQQRQRAAGLLSVAAQYPDFPIVLEAMRECLQDVLDVPALVQLMRDIQSRTVRLIDVETPTPSPFARSLLFGFVAAFLYDGDSPIAERRAQALTLDPSMLAELLGSPELRDLLDPEAIAEVERSIALLQPDQAMRDAEDVADLLRRLGDLTTGEVVLRGGTARQLAELEETRRALRLRVAGEERWVAIEDAGRYRDALGVPLPVGVPDAFTEPVADPLVDLVSRFARTHGPFVVSEPAARFGLGVAVIATALARLAASGRVVSGQFRPTGAEKEWCDAEVLRRIRRMSVARSRAEAEPVPPVTLGRFLPAWQGVAGTASGHDAILRAVEQLHGAAVPASALERLVLPARVGGYAPSMLDELCIAGEIVWVGAGELPQHDGWVSLALADDAPLVLPTPADASLTDRERAVLDALAEGAAFFRDLTARLPGTTDNDLVETLWSLVWAGLVTNDTLAPLRTRLGASTGRAWRSRRSRPGRPALPTRAGPPVVTGRWSLAPGREADTTRRSTALVEAMLDRYGVLTRDAVMTERFPGGFSSAYRILSAMEDAGRARRAYAIEGLGGAQFALPGAVDRLRAHAAPHREPMGALVLAATDPANPYGAALPWPDGADGTGHRPGRKAGALVVLVDGALVVYVERGGKSLLTFGDEALLQPAVDALALAVRDGALGALAVERGDGADITQTPLGEAMRAAGFHATPRGLRLRG
jgi:ATP-dependent Lhr-like helicase